MTPGKLLDALSIQIYSPPLSEHRNAGRISDTSIPLSVVMLVLDFDTEVSMNGINNFLGNSTGKFARETVTALQIIGCSAAAQSLSEILDIAAQAGMTHAAIREDMAAVKQHDVVTWRQLHGDKWDAASAAIREVEEQISYEDVASKLELFVRDHQGSLEPLVSAGPP